MRRGAASARANLKGPVAQGEATKAAMKQAGEEAPMPREARALESGKAEAPSIAEATESEAEAPRTSEAEVVEAGASRDSEAKVVDTGAPRTTEAEVAEAGLGAEESVAQDAKTDVGQASVPPSVQDPPPSQERLKKEASRVAKASVVVQAVLEAKIQEHNALQSAARTTYEALEVGGVESGSSVRSRLIVLSGRVHEQLWGALHMGVKHALAVVSSHYASIDLKAVSDGYVMAEDDEKAEEEVMKLVEVAKAPSTALTRLFEEEVVPPTLIIDAGDPEF
ncbi:uncharacterized protein [Miscanthus floridulus]|uniref:uncharacterized protein n=1 Tax=Miscanthus floridulus TaxID=154761 RepID=UPI003457C4CD